MWNPFVFQSAGLIWTIIFYLMAQVDGQDDCIRLADCYAKQADVHKDLGQTDLSTYYEKARLYIKEHKKYKGCRIRRINDNCKAKLSGCKGRYRTIVREEMKGKIGEGDLLNRLTSFNRQCNFDYALFFCRNNDPAHWPAEIQDIYQAIKVDYNVPCEPSCGLQAFQEYHETLGKKYPDDFPSDWEQKLKEELKKEKEIEKMLSK